MSYHPTCQAKPPSILTILMKILIKGMHKIISDVLLIMTIQLEIRLFASLGSL
jgi:hypothetical protein